MSTPKTILVIDVESTCWENLPPNRFPETRNEIIEIGITAVDVKTKEILSSEAIFCLPPTTEITDFCTRLTTLTPEFIAENGIPFPDAIRILDEKYRAERNIFASWGLYDWRAFEKNCRWSGIRFPFSNLNLNVKALFSAKFGYNGGVEKIAGDLGLKFEGTPHRGVDDSRMIARILQRLLA